MKKLIVLLVTLLVLMGAMTVGSFAVSSDCVMTVDGTEYTDFVAGWNAGVQAAEDKSETVEVVLYADWKANSNGSFGSGKGFKADAIYVPEDITDLTLNMNGHTIDRGLYVWDDFEKDAVVNNGRKSGEVMHIDEDAEGIIVKNGTITGGNNLNYGGIYIDEATVLFDNVKFISNKSEQGGALYNNEGHITFTGCYFERNYAVYGGAVYSDYDDVTIDNCDFKNNKAKYGGGAVYNYGAEFVIKNTNFIENEAKNITEYSTSTSYTGDGGALYCDGGSTEVSNCIFDGNESYSKGGALNHNAGSLNVTDTTFKNNSAVDNRYAYGGACFLNNNAQFTGCEFLNNSAVDTGACYVDDTVDFTGCTFIGNSVLEHGTQNPSVMLISLSGEVNMKDCVVKRNIGDGAIDIFADFLDAGQLWFDGEMVVTDNCNSKGQELNVVCHWGNPFSSYIVLKDGFSKNSRVGVGLYDSETEGNEAVDNIPSSWSIEDLARCFTVDDAFFVNEEYEDIYYLEKSWDILVFETGDPEDSIHASLPVEEPPVDNPEEEIPVTPKPPTDTPSKPSTTTNTATKPDKNATADTDADAGAVDNQVDTTDVDLNESADDKDTFAPVVNDTDNADSNGSKVGSVFGSGSSAMIIILVVLCAAGVISAVVIKNKKNK